MYKVPSRMKYEFRRNLPVYADSLLEDLNYPLAWGNSDIKDFGEWKKVARQKVFDCMLMPPPAAGDFSVKVIREEQREGYRARQIEIKTSKYYSIPALILIPNGKGPFPVINCLHDHGGHLFIGKEKMIRPFEPDPDSLEVGNLVALEDSVVLEDAEKWVEDLYEGQFVGDFLAQKGYVVFSSDAPLWGERGQKEGALRSKFDMICGNMMMYGIDFSAYMTYDDIACTEYIATLPFVDPKRIGCLGLSMGGYRSWLLSALCDKIKVGVAICWMVTTQEQMSFKYSRTENGGFANTFPGLRRWLDYPHVASIACPKPMLFINGSRDKLFPLFGARRAFKIMHEVYTDQKSDKYLETEIWDITHSFPKAVQNRALEFLKEHL